MKSKNQSVFLRAAIIPATLGLMALHVTPTETQTGLILPPESEVLPDYDIVQPEPPISEELFTFLHLMGERESSNRYDVVNQYGYMGRYQFSKRTLYSLGDEFKVSRREFLSNPALQDSAMIENLRRNRSTLRSLISRLEGKRINGITITESGLLAGAHLVGPSGVKAWADPNYTITVNGKQVRPRISDGNGVKVSEYISEFSGYELALGR